MQKINKHNYEAFFLDYLEGNLADKEEQQLLHYLKENPELRAELEEMMEVDLNDLNLTPPNAILSDKSPLIKENEELEEMMIAEVEGILSEEEKEKLHQQIKYKDLTATYKYYQNTRLKPDKKVVYPNKTELKHKEVKIIPIFYKAVSAAAVIILLIGLYFMNWDSEISPDNSVVEINKSALKTIEPKNSFAKLEHRKLREALLKSENQHSKTNVAVDNQQTVVSDLAENNDQENNNTQLTNSSKSQFKKDADSVKKPAIVPIKNIEIEDDPIVEKTLITDDLIPLKDDSSNEENDVALTEDASNQTKNNSKEQPFKLFTDAAGNLLNREVYYKREKESDNEVVAHHFKLGSFEFQRTKH